jgi:cyclopropane fatty-acyl-phospholipid synthase-like methyltransferase
MSDFTAGSGPSELLAPDAAYWTGRYRNGDDRWSRPENITKLITDSLIDAIRELPELRDGARFLDIGCGTMWTSVLIKEAFPQSEILGIDFALDAVFRADGNEGLEQALAAKGLAFRECDLYNFTPDAPYDAVLDIGLLHHLPPSDWPRYSVKVASFLRPGGSLLMRSFHPDDVNWTRAGGTGPGGHVRKGYYCHYHTAESVAAALGPWFGDAREIGQCDHEKIEHVESLFHLKRTDRTLE